MIKVDKSFWTDKKRLIRAIQILAEADLRNGVKPEKIQSDINKYIKQERYEICEGLKLALENKKS